MNTEKKLSYEDFIRSAILKLRNTSKSRGIHVVYSGFNQAFRKYYSEDPISKMQELSSNGKFEIRYVKGGVMLYLPGEAPVDRTTMGDNALDKILGVENETSTPIINDIYQSMSAEGVKSFPKDFIGTSDDLIIIDVPPIPLKIDSFNNRIVIGQKGNFKYEATNPAVAKFIVFASGGGEKIVKVPKDNRKVFAAVVDYEKYCRETSEKAYELLFARTQNEELAFTLREEILKMLRIRNFDENIPSR